MQPNVDSAPSVSKSHPAPASAVIPGLAWIPAVTVEWSHSAIKAGGGWSGTATAFRMAARRALSGDDAPALKNGARLDPIDYILVCHPHEGFMFLVDGGDERPITLGDMRLILAQLDRLAADGTGPHSLAAQRAITRIAEHLAAHGLRIGTH